MAGELLASISAEIDARLGELRPSVDEYRRLLSAAEALGLSEGAAESAPAKPAPRARRSSAVSRPSRAPRVQRTSEGDGEEIKAPVPPAAKAGRRGSGRRGSAAGAIVRAGSSSPGRAVRGAAQQAILAALEHGSHTVGELTVVTAMSGQNIRENLRRMLSSGAVTRAKREGKAAYALAGGAGQ
jgi:hypothetical protein